MPRQYSIPKYRRHKATGQAIVTLSGRMHYLGPYGTRVSRNEYDRLVLEWLANERCPPVSAEQAAGLSVAEFLRRYWRYAKAYYRKDGKPTGEQHPLLQVIKLVSRLYGRIPCEEFGPLKLQAVQQQMIGRDWTRKVINRQVQRIVRIFRWGTSQELVPASVFQRLASVRGLPRGRCNARESQPVLPVSDETVNATLKHLPAVVADMVRIQGLTGMRPDEVCRVRPCDIDRGSDVWIYYPGTHKTEHHGRTREVAIGPRAQALLLPYLARPTDQYCFRPVESEQHRRLERHSRRRTPFRRGNRPGTNRSPRPRRTAGDRYTPNSYRRAIVRACERAFPLPEAIRDDAAAVLLWRKNHWWAPNRLRHKRATEIRAHFGLEAAQVCLGHQNANVTEIYAERDRARASAVARELG